MSDQGKIKIPENLRQVLADQDIYELVYVSSLTLATLEIHITHNGEERDNNFRVGKILEDHGYSGQILEVSHERKNPDYKKKDGEIMDFKTQDGERSITNGIRNAMKKSSPDRKVTHVVFDVRNYGKKKIADQLRGQFKREQLKEVWLIISNAIIYIRRESLENDLTNLP